MSKKLRLKLCHICKMEAIAGRKKVIFICHISPFVMVTKEEKSRVYTLFNVLLNFVVQNLELSLEFFFLLLRLFFFLLLLFY